MSLTPALCAVETALVPVPVSRVKASVGGSKLSRGLFSAHGKGGEDAAWLLMLPASAAAEMEVLGI